MENIAGFEKNIPIFKWVLTNLYLRVNIWEY